MEKIYILFYKSEGWGKNEIVGYFSNKEKAEKAKIELEKIYLPGNYWIVVEDVK